MNYKDQILRFGPAVWPIELATHLNTPIFNETSAPSTTLKGGPAHREATLRTKYHRRLPPVSGYNCFGCVFASRRTGIYPPDDPQPEKLATVIGRILAEDGYGTVLESDVEPGDIVLYGLEGEPFHAAFITRVDTRPAAGHAVKVPIALSKFDNDSGEYEHPVHDLEWTPFRPLSIEFHRPRTVAPSKRWFEKIARFDPHNAP